MDGWISLHRKLLGNPVVCKDSDHIAVWMYLLLKATYQERQELFAGEKITLQPGQLITGRKAISEKFNISESKVQRILKLFESEQQIGQQTSNKNRLITILSWHAYQETNQLVEHQTNNKRTTIERQLNTYNKEIKKQDKEYTSEFEEFWNHYPRKLGKQRSFELWKTRLKDEAAETLIQCAKHYADSCKQNGTATEYIKHPSTFLSAKKDYEDYLEPLKPKPPLRVINGIPELVTVTDEEREWFAEVRRKQTERNKVAYGK